MTDALVVGGGPAGASLAILLAGAGRDVTVIEREVGQPDKVCGEFISCEAAADLAAVGLRLANLGAVPIETVRLVHGAEEATARLPFSAYSLSRRTLDAALLDRAAAAGATVIRGARVQALARRGAGYVARLAGGGQLEGRAAFLATGKHDLHGWSRPAGRQDDLVAFKMHWDLVPAQRDLLESCIELFLFRDGYGGLSLVEAGAANLCFVVTRRRLHALGGAWDGLVKAILEECPHVAERLSGATPRSSHPLTLGSIPYGLVVRESGGVFRLGDQAVVIPSFAGDGISIALHSARVAASAYLEGRGPAAYQRALAKDVSRQVKLATAVSLALVRSPAWVTAWPLARLLPRLMPLLAAHTRVPQAALDRARTLLDGSADTARDAVVGASNPVPPEPAPPEPAPPEPAPPKPASQQPPSLRSGRDLASWSPRRRRRPPAVRAR